jgi:4-carboxymuconolactone decarboxylase
MDEPTTRQQRFEHGWEVLSSVDGETGERVIDSLSAIAPELVHQIVAWGYGEISARPGLAPATASS